MPQKLPPTRPRWGIREVILVLLLLTGFIFLLDFAKPIIMDLTTDIYRDRERRELALMFGGSALQALLMIGLTAYFLKKKGGKFSQLGFTTKGLIKNLKTGIWGGIILLLSVVALGWVTNLFLPEPPEPQPFAKIVENVVTWPEVLIPFVVSSVFAPLSEEVYFRGFTYPVLRNYLGPIPGMIFTGLFFGAMHMDVVRLLPLSLGGIGLAWLYERTGSIYTSITAHAVWNGIMTAIIIFGQKLMV